MSTAPNGTTGSGRRRFKTYPVYKDSGVEWLGNIPTHWDITRVKRRAKRIQTGSTPPTTERQYYEEGVMPWYGPASFGEDLPLREPAKFISATALHDGVARVFETGSVAIITIGATVGKVALMEQAGSCNQQITGVTFRASQVLPRYGAYQLKRLEPVLRGLAPNTTLPIVDQAEVGYLWLMVPPLPEQRAIAAFLDRQTAKIDALVSEKERLIERLQEKRTALITRAVTKGLNPEVSMKDSGIKWLGEIPAHWDVRRIAMAAVKITNGYVGPTRDILVNDGIRYLQSLHIKEGSIEFERHPYFVTPEWSRQHKKSVLAEGDVLVVQTGGIGQVAVVPNKFAGCNCHALIIIRLKPRLATGEWLSYALQSDYGQAALAWSQTGALHPHLECGHVREIRIAIPPPDEQKVVLRRLKETLVQVDALIGRVRMASERLHEYRTALISTTVTGKIDVREDPS